MAISVVKPSPPDPYTRARTLRYVASLCLAEFHDADDAQLIERMKKVLAMSGESALYAECVKALAVARVEARANERRRRRNERIGYLLFYSIVAIAFVLLVFAILHKQ